MNQAEFDDSNENIGKPPSIEKPEDNFGEKGKKRNKQNFLKGNIARVGGVVTVLVFQLFAAYVIMSYVVVPKMQKKAENWQKDEKKVVVEETDQETGQIPPEQNMSQEQTVSDVNPDVYKSQQNALQTPLLDPRCVVQYEDIIINLAFTGGDRYFILSLAVVTSSEDAARELVDKEPIIYDFFISWLSKRGEMWYSNFENHNTLRNELKEQISARLQEGYVTYIFFTKYVIQ